MDKFLKTIYANTDSGFVSVWEKHTKLTSYFKVDDFSGIEAFCLKVAETSDVYFGVCPRKTVMHETKRGSEADVLCLPALYFDFDTGTEHKKQVLPKNNKELSPFLNSLPVLPSVVVTSGNGVHAYWVLREPITDLIRAKEILSGWNRYIISKGKELGWDFDNVGELARVLRLPGTNNFKTDPPKTVKTTYITDAQFNECDFDDYIIEELSADELLIQGMKGDAFEIPEVVEEGERNNVLFRMASSLRAKGLSAGEIAGALAQANKERLKVPLSPDEILTIARSAGKYLQGDLALNPTVNTILVDIDKIEADDLLTEDTLRGILMCNDELKIHQALMALKKKAQAARITTKDFDEAVKIVREIVRKERQQTDPQVHPSGIELPEGLTIPDGWTVEEGGIYRVRTIKGVTVTDWACGHPIIVSQRLVNVDSQAEKLKVQFKRDGSWHDFIVLRSILASRQSIVNLSDYGIMVNAETAKNLITWLHDLEYTNIETMVKSKSVSRLGWVGPKTFSPYSEDVVFDGEAMYRDMYDAVKASGSEERWLEEAAAMKKQLYARSALAASFASPLLSILGKPIFFLHYWGETGAGKTVMLKAAMSVWGNPNILMKTFNSTAVGLEKHAGFMGHLPLALDEMQSRKDQDNMDYILYSLSEGKSKGRGTRTGGVETEQRWQCIILTNGENPITSTHSGGGAKNRAIEIYAPDDIFEDAAGTADIITENFGYAGEKFIGRLMDTPRGDITRRYRFFREQFLSKGYGQNYTDKQLTALAVVCLGDFYSAQYVFGEDEESALASAVAFSDQLKECLTSISDVDVVERTYEWIQGWLASNTSHFIEGFAAQSPRYGVISKDGTYCIISGVLTDEIERRGVSSRKVISGFAKKGYLRYEGEKYSRVINIDGHSVRCYAIKGIPVPETLEGDEDAEPYEGQLPFPSE